jgi:hypothetical protein
MADIEVRAAMRRAAAGLHLFVDRARDDIARRELFLHRVVIEHEARALCVEEEPALAAHRLGDKNAARSRGPDHARRMELHELHVEQVRAGRVRHRGAVAGALP